MAEDVKEKVYAFLNKKKASNQVSMMTSVDEIIQDFNISSINAKVMFMDWAKDNMYAKNITSNRQGRTGFAKLVGIPARIIDKHIIKEEKQDARSKE